MKKNWIIAIFMAGLCLQTARAQGSFFVGSQSQVVCQGNPAIVLQHVSFDNNGHVEAAQSAFYFSGTPVTISGDTPTTFFDLSVGTEVALKTNIGVNGGLLFEDGQLFPGDHTVDLAETGSFYFENNNSRMGGNGSGYATVHAKLLSGAENEAGPGNLGVRVLESSQEDYADFRRGYSPSMTPAGSSIARWYEVLPSGNNEDMNASVRFWYLDAELGGLEEGKLTVWSSDDGGATWFSQPTIARNKTENWIDINGQNTLTRYTLAGPDSMLPLAGTTTGNTATIGLATLEVFPNPVSTTAVVRIRVFESTKTVLRWQAASGEVVRSMPVELVEGINDFSEMVADLPAGVWFVSVGLPGIPAIRVVKN